jgi:hypothetical protein
MAVFDGPSLEPLALLIIYRSLYSLSAEKSIRQSPGLISPNLNNRLTNCNLLNLLYLFSSSVPPHFSNNFEIKCIAR